MIIQVVVMIDKNQTKKSMFRSGLRDYSDTYIVAVTDPDNNAYDKKLVF